MELQKITLKNGLRILNIFHKDLLTSTVLVLVEAGSEYETKEKNGISHFLEHMCFKGTKKRPNSKIIAEELEVLGGQFNAFTSNNYTGYFAKSNAGEIDKVFDVISDIYLRSIYNQKEIEKERGVIHEEINMYEDLPQHKVVDLLNQLMYRDQPAGWQILGTRETLANIKRSTFVEYVNNHYIASKTLVVVASPFPIQEIARKTEKYFKNIRVGRKIIKRRTFENQIQPGFLAFHKKTDQTHLVLGIRTFSAKEEKWRPALNLLNIILGGGMASRLFQSLREKHGLCYYSYSAGDFYTDRGMLTIHSGIDNNRTELALKIILSEIKKLKNNKVGSGELNRAKEYLKNYMALELETSNNLAFFFGIEEILSGKSSDLNEIMKKIDKVTSEDIKSLAEKIFQPNKMNLAFIGPDGTEHDNKLKTLLYKF